MIDFDKVLSQIGGFGKYQITNACIIGYYGLIVAHFTLASIFTSKQPDFVCNVDQDGVFNLSRHVTAGQNGTNSNVYPTFKHEHELAIDYCHVKTSFCVNDESVDCDQFTDGVENGEPTVYACNDFVYDNSTWTNTVVTEFNLVCDNSEEAAVPDEAYMIGMAISMLTMGGVSDMYGRRRTLFWCQLCLCIVSFGQIFSQNLYGFAASRFFQGFFMSSGYSAAFIFLTEIVDSEKRAKLGLSVNVLFGAGSVFYSLGGFMFRNWRHLISWVFAHATLACVGCYFIDESPRWLITRGQSTEAFEISKKIAKKNGREITVEDFESCDSRVQGKSVESITLVSLFKSRMMAKITLVQCYLWAAIAMGYYGISLSVGDLAGDIFVINVVMGLMEMAAVIALMFNLDRLSRHKITAVTFFGSGISYLICGLLDVYGTTESAALASTAFALIGKFFTSACYSCIYIYSAELYPTSCRNTGFSCCVLASRIASIIVPKINQVGHDSAKWLPPILFGSSCLVAGGATLWLPDTFGVPLLETMEQAEKFYSNPYNRYDDEDLEP